jgi:phosphate transport system protein
MDGHIVKAYDAELEELDRMAVQMGGLAERQLADAFHALERRDARLAEQAVTSDRKIDDLERQLQERTIQIIARRQPMANDLRHIMTVLKIAGDLERIGDLAKNSAKRAMALSQDSPPKHFLNGLRHMNELAMRQLKTVLDTFSARDEVRALEVWREDARLDALYTSVFRELLTYMMEDPRHITMCTHLLFGAKNLERIGDHTTNIAENVHFLVTGETLDTERPKSDGTSALVLDQRGQ